MQIIELARTKLQALVRNRTGMNAVRDPIEDLVSHGSQVPTVIDAGAYRGNVTQEILNRRPNATIHAVEPQPKSAAHLRQRFAEAEQVTVHEVALGRTDDETELNVSRNDVSSSLYDTSETHLKAAPDSASDSTVAVERTTLDQICAEPDLIKLDLQGAELDVIHGAESVVNTANAVLVEIQFVELYEGVSTYDEIIRWFKTNDWSLINVYDLYTDEDGQLLWGDVLFVQE